MSLSANDFHALRGLVRAHRKRKIKKLDGFAARPGQSRERVEEARRQILTAAAYYAALESRVHQAEWAAKDGEEI